MPRPVPTRLELLRHRNPSRGARGTAQLAPDLDERADARDVAADQQGLHDSVPHRCGSTRSAMCRITRCSRRMPLPGTSRATQAIRARRGCCGTRERRLRGLELPRLLEVGGRRQKSCMPVAIEHLREALRTIWKPVSGLPN
jgi:hypothetical protein